MSIDTMATIPYDPFSVIVRWRGQRSVVVRIYVEDVERRRENLRRNGLLPSEQPRTDYTLNCGFTEFG
jgi:hypothetical protein